MRRSKPPIDPRVREWPRRGESEKLAGRHWLKSKLNTFTRLCPRPGAIKQRRPGSWVSAVKIFTSGWRGKKQRSENRCQRSEVRGQRSESRGQKPKVRRQRARPQTTEIKWQTEFKT